MDNLNDIQKRLRSVNIADAHDVPFKNKIVPARLVKVTDGDTIQVVILMGDNPLLIKVRLNGIDAPETALRGKTTQLEKDAGLLVKKYVASLLKDDIVFIKLVKLDKYGGRCVGHVYATECCCKKNECISTKLMSLKYVKEYNGEKKSAWETKELEYIIEKCK